jgi:hypothetical protein
MIQLIGAVRKGRERHIARLARGLDPALYGLPSRQAPASDPVQDRHQENASGMLHFEFRPERGEHVEERFFPHQTADPVSGPRLRRRA